MNYRHIYHAGNFADVLKHCVLIMLSQSLQKKDTPVFYLDTHAGVGKYDLTTAIAQKTREYENGVARVYHLRDCPAVISTYKSIVRSINPQTKMLHFYPGSPLITRALMRTQDQMVLTELHQEDVQTLKKYFYLDKQVAVHHVDGYSGLKAFLPPKEGRGLVLIDPPFEVENEFAQIADGLQIALKRFPAGVYLVWFPIKNQGEISNFYAELKNIKCKNILAIELAISKNITNSGLTSCGLVIINVPWQFDFELKSVISWLFNALTTDPTRKLNIKWIKTGL
jgi:23S rRNA (adenine2030-N6)-methyltransferase